MILNSGLDAACTTNSFRVFYDYAAIGTGSSAPSVEQTSLDAQVGSRSSSSGGFDNVEDAGKDDDTDVIWYEITTTRVFNIDSNVNVAEWGTSVASTGNLSVRELFREDPQDNESDPITLTLESGDQLQLVITFRVQAAWEYEVKSFVITGTAGNDGTGTHEGKASVATNLTAANDLRAVLSAVWPGDTSFSSYRRLTAYGSDQTNVGKGDGFSGNNIGFVTLSADSYTPGTFYRDYTGQFSTSNANGDHYAWVAGFGDDGLRFILTNPVKLTKEPTHRLTLTIRKSISRL